MFSSSSTCCGVLPMDFDSSSFLSDSDESSSVTTTVADSKKTVSKKIVAVEVMKKKLQQIQKLEKSDSSLKYFQFNTLGRDSSIVKAFARALWKQGQRSNDLSLCTRVGLNLSSNFDVNLIMEMPQGVVYEFDYGHRHILGVNGYDEDETTLCAVFAFKCTDIQTADMFMTKFYRAACIFYKRQKENPDFISGKIIRNGTSTTHQFRTNSLHYLTEAKYTQFIDDFTTYMSDREEYGKYGITGTRVYHVDGPQNIGKKMLVYDLAHKYHLDVTQLTSTIVVNPAEIQQELSALFSSMPRNGIIICDCENDTSFVDTQLKIVVDAFKFSTLSSAIFVMNLGMHRSNVDVEFDYIVEYEKPTFEQVETLCNALMKNCKKEEIKRFYDKVTPNGIPMMDIRSILFKIRNMSLADTDKLIKGYKPTDKSRKRINMYS